jgi:hypothetical protein
MTADGTSIPLFKRMRVEITLSDRAGLGYDIPADVYVWRPREDVASCPSLELAGRDWDSKKFKGKSLDAFLMTFDTIA